ncbi:permease prefix domain 1-containing protein [Alkalibacillus salilacus]|uniref:permease prefix domain 1-containing protein n=1 Tax=Alkalibacillus salilacus TaxID=284582 RepID=UPI0027D8C8BC|nr:permease prefix domain 1-containing protein [Alkalibacillus salilacus]
MKRIVAQTDCKRSERDDLYEEMLTHVLMRRDEEMEAGKTEKEAEEEAMKMFGKEAHIGDGLQQAMFPYRRELLLLLALVSFLFTSGKYITVLVQEQTALWYLLVGMVVHSVVLFFALNRTFAVNRKLWIALGLVFNLIFLLTQGQFWTYYDFLGPVLPLMLLLNLYLLYRTVLTYERQKDHKMSRRMIHIVNITLSLVGGLAALNIHLMAMGFGAPATILLNVFIPMALWAVLYTVQIRLLSRFPKLVVGSLVLTVLILAYMFWPFIVPPVMGLFE